MQATAKNDSSKLPPPHAKNALQNTINIDRELPDFVAPKPSFY